MIEKDISIQSSSLSYLPILHLFTLSYLRPSCIPKTEDSVVSRDVCIVYSISFLFVSSLFVSILCSYCFPLSFSLHSAVDLILAFSISSAILGNHFFPCSAPCHFSPHYSSCLNLSLTPLLPHRFSISAHSTPFSLLRHILRFLFNCCLSSPTKLHSITLDS